MLDRIATRFERKVLFGFGRHLWNVAGVAGVVAIAAGGVMFASSATVGVLSYPDWLKQQKDQDPVKAREIIGQAPVVESWGNRCYETNNPQYCEVFREKKKRLQAIAGDWRERYEAYSAPKERWNRDAKLRRAAAPFVAGWGAGTLGTVSVISAILAVERNTRRQ